jgi:hypothetical protein
MKFRKRYIANKVEIWARDKIAVLRRDKWKGVPMYDARRDSFKRYWRHDYTHSTNLTRKQNRRLALRLWRIQKAGVGYVGS